MSEPDSTPSRVQWARLRFSVIGSLLHSPPSAGELKETLELLARRQWLHPATREPIRFGVSTIERWFYQARGAENPIDVLTRKVPSHAGAHPSISKELMEKVRAQYKQHPTWSYQLHHDNLAALVRGEPSLGEMPSYPTVRRAMKGEALIKQKKRKARRRKDGEEFVPRETRSFEFSHVNGLWHSDFHESSRKIIMGLGKWLKADGLCIMDDRSRLACHFQWYPEECAEAAVHGWSQAFQKRGLPRAALNDNGCGYEAEEFRQGLSRLSIVQHDTLPNSPEQNGKQECFWGQVEGRLLAMLEGEQNLTLELLNKATQAWVELEYNRTYHSEIGMSPLEAFLKGPSLARPSPSSDTLRRVFRIERTRKQRRTDGTITVEGVRFELPSRYRTLIRPTIRYSRWDLSSIDLVDPRTGAFLTTLLPIDKEANADGRRRVLEPVAELGEAPPPPAGVAPRLKELMADYAATGLPPAYIPYRSQPETQEGDHQ